ncbi:MAG: hypothetical protein GC205_12810 [Bacteroidetes bacterium]|nr:hypothetical protein [Bacteroidota bacterium]
MLRLRIFGTGCERQRMMEDKVRQAAVSLGLNIDLSIVQDLDLLIERRVSRTPALEINGKLAIVGRVPFRAELIELFRMACAQNTELDSYLMKVSPRNERTHGRATRSIVGLDQVKHPPMKTPITWIVGLDFTAMDRAVIEYTASLADMLSPEKIYFVHVYPNLDLPDIAKSALSDAELPLDERLVRDMQTKVREEFPESERYATECMVVEGKPESQLLRWAHIKTAELMIMGRKKRVGGSGVIPRRIARKSECSVLFVPEKPTFQLRTFLVPTDFSAPSAKALETAEWISDHIQGSELFLFHACHLPSSIYYDGLAGSNMVDLLREAAEEQMEEFKEKYQAPNARVIVNAKADRSVARTVAESASDLPADMILIGGKGRSGLTGALIGSVTESLLQSVEDVPVWVVKTAHKRQLHSKSPDAAAKSRA